LKQKRNKENKKQNRKVDSDKEKFDKVLETLLNTPPEEKKKKKVIKNRGR